MNEQILIHYHKTDESFLLSIITKGVDGLENMTKSYTIPNEQATEIIESLKNILG